MAAKPLTFAICIAIVLINFGARQARSQTIPRVEQDAPNAPAQATTYHVPFGSRGNTIRLEVVNGSGRAAKELNIIVKDIPEWMEFTPTSFVIGNLAAGKYTTSSFRFAVNKEAPVGKKVTLRFVAKSAGEYRWEKKISLSVNAPAKLTLNQNYPNPFNPSTTISYKLPARMEVRVTVFNVLGRRVVTLADETQPAGLQQIRWDASRYASGLYFYRIVADGPGQQKIVRNKKMMLIK